MRQILLTTTVLLAIAATAVQPAPAIAAPAAPAEAGDLDFAPLTVPAPKAGRGRPLVVVVAGSGGAETTDFAIPYGVLKDSGVAEVLSLSTRRGPVQLMRVMKVMPDATLAEFDADQPLGADIVVVPAQMSPKDEALAAWLKAQAAKGATIVSICEGARVLAHAGLLEGRQATTHWSAYKSLEKGYPQTSWVRDRRYLQDGPIISTSGVSASIPASLALVAAIGGRETALATAKRLGLSQWSAAHRTADFGVTSSEIAGAAGSLLAIWSHETVEFPLVDGMDEVTLALRVDAWSRSFRAKVVTTSTLGEVRSRHGLRIIADARPSGSGRKMQASDAPAAVALDAAFAEIGERYGAAAAHIARMGMEYDQPVSTQRVASAGAEGRP